MAGSDEQRDSAVVSSAGDPGPLSRLLQELAVASGEDLLEAWKSELRPGDRVGRFEVRCEVGRGGFGAVYEAFDTELNRIVALKALRLSRPRRDLATGWLKKEAEAVARLDHPCIVTLFDVGTCPSGPYLVMELLHGKTLAERIAEGPLPPDEAMRIAEEMAKGLAHAHQRGVLHRDLKPANVFLCEDGRVKLLDFGLAHLLGTDGPIAAGTPAYMAPEQARGEEVDQRADVYAAGKVLGEMLGAKAPRPLARAVASATSADPSGRPRDGTAWLELLQSTRRIVERPSRFRRVAILAGAGVVIGAVVAGLGIRRSTHSSNAAQVDPLASIAVLPFTDMSPGKDQEYLADGVAEEILNALSRVDGLRVPGRTSSFWFKGKDVALAEIGSRLNVTHALEGSVRRDGGRIRVAAQVVKVADGFQVWSRTFDRDLTDIFAIEDEIAREVVEELRVKLVGPPRGATEGRTVNVEAHASFLRGKHFARLGTEQGHRLAAESYERSIALDPSYGPAHAGLGWARWNLASFHPDELGPDADTQRARDAAERAIALAPGLPDGYALRGAIRTQDDFDWAGARSDLERARELGPDDPNVAVLYGRLLASQGRLDQAIAVTRKALDRDPLSSHAAWFLASYYNASVRLELARKVLALALQTAPDHTKLMRELCNNYILAGQPAEALAAVAKSVPFVRIRCAALAAHDLGQRAESDKVLEQLQRWNGFWTAQVHAWRGEKDRAFEALEQAAEGHDDAMPYLKYDPFLRPLHTDPRWQALLRKMNLPVD